MKVDGRVALVTGAARGIGRAIAERLAAAGADVVAADLERDWLRETEAAVTARGRRALSLAVDVSDAASVAAAVAAAQREFDRIDILVNNAGITRDGLLLRMSDEAWDRVMAVNLRGAFLVTRAAARHMIKRRSGAIVNIASIIGLIGNAGQCNYAASKAGVIALTKSTARELAPRGIRANAVAPGFIETRMTGQLPEETRREMLARIPLGRFGEPADVASVVLFLASDAASYITGQVVAVSGGMVM